MPIEIFIRIFSNALVAILKQHSLDKFAKACEHALREACGKHKEVTSENYPEIAKEFFPQ